MQLWKRAIGKSAVVLSITITFQILAFAAPGLPASASTLDILYAFCRKSGCNDGTYPRTGLLMDQTGNLYGVTVSGARHMNGNVFELVPDHRTWKFKDLHDFCGATCDDGASYGSLIMDINGNLYGTTVRAKSSEAGTVFELSPDVDHRRWTFKTLYRFCSEANCEDGSQPYDGLTYAGASVGEPYDGASPLFGTTSVGGNRKSGGTVFQIAPIQGASKWNETTLYTFCSQPKCSDGKRSIAGLLVDQNNNLFGTTYNGGKKDHGVIFELSPIGGSWAETVLHTFCPRTDCKDGEFPGDSLIMDPQGFLYGTSEAGGDHGFGTIFRLVPNGLNSQETVLHSFCTANGCDDGATPAAGLLLDSQGNLFGTTEYGGVHAMGAIFELSGSQYSVLYSFCSLMQCPDGYAPLSPLIMNANGDLFGTTSLGGANGSAGIVFDLQR